MHLDDCSEHELTFDAEAELEAGKAAADVRAAATVTEYRLKLQTVAAQLLQHPGRLLEPVRPRLAVLTHVMNDCLVFLRSLPHHLRAVDRKHSTLKQNSAESNMYS